LTDFHGDEAKEISFVEKKKIQNSRLKKTEFFKIANSQFFLCEIFLDWSLGLIDAKGIDVAQLIWL
jgi:hypothetical protein